MADESVIIFITDEPAVSVTITDSEVVNITVSEGTESGGGGGGVTSVSGTAPIVSSGGATPAISINEFAGSTKGAVPTSAGGTTNFLRADGSWAAPAGSAGTNLGYTPAVGNGVVTSDTGTDATIPAADGTNAGLFLASEKSKLSGIEAGAEVNNISDANATDLTDGGNTTLHTHDSRYYTETEVDTALALKAPLASPTFTGTPAAPTASPGTNTTQLATTAFVNAAITALPNNVSAGATVTGTTSNTFSKALDVTGAFEAAKGFTITQTTVKTGTAGTTVVRFYANQTADLAGSPILLGTSTAVGATGRSAFLQRTLRIYTLDGTGSGTETINTTFASITDWQTTPTTAVSNSAVDWSTYIYICVSIQLSNSGDSAFCSFIGVSR